jgi:DNA-directed RNA polymerase subunit RPC12/RpoP
VIRYTCTKCAAKMDSPASTEGQSETCPECGNLNLVPYAVTCGWDVPGEHRSVKANGPAWARFSDTDVTIRLERPLKLLSYWWAVPLTGISLLLGQAGWEVVVGLPGWFLIIFGVNRWCGRTTLWTDPTAYRALYLTNGQFVCL